MERTVQKFFKTHKGKKVMKRTILAFVIVIAVGFTFLYLACDASKPIPSQSVPAEKTVKDKVRGTVVLSENYDYPEATVEYVFWAVGKEPGKPIPEKVDSFEDAVMDGSVGYYFQVTRLTEPKSGEVRFYLEKARVTLKESSATSCVTDPGIFTEAVITEGGEIRMMQITHVFLRQLAKRVVDIKDKRHRIGICSDNTVDVTDNNSLSFADSDEVEAVTNRAASFLAKKVIENETGYLSLNEVVAANEIIIRYLRATYSCLKEDNPYTVIKQGIDLLKDLVDLDFI